MEVQAFVTRNPKGFVPTFSICRFKHVKKKMLFLDHPNTNNEFAQHHEQRGVANKHEPNQRELLQLEVDLIQTLKNPHKSQSIADVYQILQEGSARFSPINKLRNQKNEILKYFEERVPLIRREGIWSLPLIRGIGALVDSLYVGYKGLVMSDSLYFEEEEDISFFFLWFFEEGPFLSYKL